MRGLRSISGGRTIEAGSFSEFGEIVMSGAAAFALAVSASLLVLGPASAQQSTTGSAPPLVAPAPALVPGGAPALATAPGLTPSRAPAAAPAAGGTKSAAKCDNPNALGVSRTVEIDTTGGPGFGFEHFKAYDFLREKEVVLTFDDGPWPGNTPAVLKALADQCTKAVFFPIGKHAGWHPEIMKQVAAAGQTVGSHTWSHKDLSRLSDEEAKVEIEKGIAGVSVGLGNQPVAAFFRFPALRHPPESVK